MVSGSDTVTVTTVSNAGMEVTKTVTVTQNDGNATNDSGDILTYTIKLKIPESHPSNLINDQLTDGGGNLTLTSGPTFSSATAEAHRPLLLLVGL